MCVLLVSSNRQSRDETSFEAKEIFSKRNEAYGIIKRPDHQLQIEVSENVAYNTVEQLPQLITSPIYETIN